MKHRYILGVHIASHDSAACLFDNNKLVCAISRERITREKHQGGNPTECIEYVLKSANIQKKDVNLLVKCIWHNIPIENEEIYDDFPKVITNNHHHLFHAYSNLLTADNIDRALCVVLDGRGCRACDAGINVAEIDEEYMYESESIYLYDGKFMIPLEKSFERYIPNKYKWGTMLNSIGYAYSVISRIIFGTHHAAGKIMALASLGKENQDIPKTFIYGNGKKFNINEDWLNFVNNLNFPISYETQLVKDLSYSLQKDVEDFCTYRFKALYEKYNINDFFLSGGVGLNCKNNGLLANQPFVNLLSVFNASGDDGVAIGIAIWAMREIYNDFRKPVWNIGTGNVYKKVNLNKMEEQINKIVNDIINGKYIGIFINGSEFGPRALGNRSIIASATNIETKELLNRAIKQREPFRPFGGIILKENLSKITNDKVASLYMLSAIHIKDHMKKEMPALIHFDGTIRMQIIEDDCLLSRILKKYEKQTNKITLINTSFNGKGEPIVETESQAIECAKKIGLDSVLINDKYLKINDF